MLSHLFSPPTHGLVLDHPQAKNVRVIEDVVYKHSESIDLQLDIYLLPNVKKSERIPAVVFMNVGSVAPGRPRVRKTPGYANWPRIVAAHGLIGISMDAGADPKESFRALYDFLDKEGQKYNIDTDRLGTWASSANTIMAGEYLMAADAYRGIKASVLYYGFFPSVPVREDLPVLFVVSQGDIDRQPYTHVWNEILTRKAPWTITMASNMPHAFDILTDNDEARTLIKQTISFWKDHLETTPSTPRPKSIEREIVEAQYWHDDEKVVAMMTDWFNKHPESKDGVAWQSYARSLFNLKKYDLAVTYYEKANEQDPRSWNFHVIGRCYAQLGEASKAFDALEKAIAAGHGTRKQYEEDQLLAPLKSDARWSDLVKRFPEK